MIKPNPVPFTQWKPEKFNIKQFGVVYNLVNARQKWLTGDITSSLGPGM